jgi:hypothetical protein
MAKFCQECGSKLNEIQVPSYSWVKCYECIPGCGNIYIQAIDIRNAYPLSETYPDIPKLLNKHSQSKVEDAVQLIEKIDYKTVSMVAFENKLLSI